MAHERHPQGHDAALARLHLRSWTNIGRPAALKTGTTDLLKDVYSVGYVPTLVTGVWMGNSNNEPMSSRDFNSAMGPGQLWRDYMKEVLDGVPVTDWERPGEHRASHASSPRPARSVVTARVFFRRISRRSR